MGRATRPRPRRLPEKLLSIRSALNLSQNGLIRHFGLMDQLTQDYISAYERGVREPPLPVLLAYANAAGVYVDALIDDDLDLPERLPCKVKREGVRRASRKKRRRGAYRSG